MFRAEPVRTCLQREGRACRGRTRAEPVRTCLQREGRVCRGRTRAEPVRTCLQREGRACRGRTRAEPVRTCLQREGRACRGRTRAERPYPRRTTVRRPAPRASRRGRRPLPQPPSPPVRCAIRPRSRRGGRDERDFTPERSEVKSRDATREGRACRGRLGARCPDWPGARSTRAALGAGRPNAPARSDGRDGKDAIHCVRTHRCAVGQDDMADRGTGSLSSSCAHMGVRREISYAVRFQCVIKSNQGQNRDLRESYRLGNQTLRKIL